MLELGGLYYEIVSKMRCEKLIKFLGDAIKWLIIEDRLPKALIMT